MDLNGFVYHKKYKGGKFIRLDFNPREYVREPGQNFLQHLTFRHFLEQNPEKEIFLTLTQTDNFYEVGNKIVINWKNYQEFCKTISQNGKSKTQAYLAKKVTHYSDADKQAVISELTSEEIISNLNPEVREEIIQKLASVRNPQIVDSNKVIIVDDENKKQVFQQILSKYPEEFLELAESSDKDKIDRFSAGHLQAHRKLVIEELKQRLEADNFHETKEDDSWQSWIYKHNWLFGINYQNPIQKQKINITGVMPDYLFPTLDGFVDILEIKLPSAPVIEEDTSRPGSWRWSKESNTAIGQIVNYLDEIDRQRLEIEREIKRVYGRDCSMLKPRAFILIGENKNWISFVKEALRKLNHSLHGIEILTYTDLLNRGNAFLSTHGDVERVLARTKDIPLVPIVETIEINDEDIPF